MASIGQVIDKTYSTLTLIGNNVESAALNVTGDVLMANDLFVTGNIFGNIQGAASINPFDQSLNTTDSPTFTNLNLSGNGIINGTLNITGAVTVASTVDGRDIATDGATLDSHVADTSIHTPLNDAITTTSNLWSASKIASLTTTKRVNIPLTTAQIDVSELSATTMLFFPWINTEFSSYTNGKLLFYATISSASFDIELINDDTLAVYATDTITTTGNHSIAITNPGVDAKLALQVTRNAAGGFDPQIFGITMTFDLP